MYGESDGGGVDVRREHVPGVYKANVYYQLENVYDTTKKGKVRHARSRANLNGF